MENPHPISIASLVTGLVEDLRRLFARRSNWPGKCSTRVGKVVKKRHAPASP